MKLFLAAALIVGGLAASATPSFAMTAAPVAPTASALVQDARMGCGPGWHPSRWGRCVPNGRGWRAPGWRGRGWHRHDSHQPRRRWHR